VQSDRTLLLEADHPVFVKINSSGARRRCGFDSDSRRSSISLAMSIPTHIPKLPELRGCWKASRVTAKVSVGLQVGRRFDIEVLTLYVLTK
jgi:hypothetical protein